MKIAHFPTVRELADFDFKVQPSVDKRPDPIPWIFRLAISV